MLYKHLILALLAATVAMARPQDVDALDDELAEILDPTPADDGGPVDISAPKECKPGVGNQDTCPAGQFCENKQVMGKFYCKDGCDTAAQDCLTPPFSGTPTLCTDNKCVYSECKVKGDCKMNQDCKLTGGINKCVDTTPAPECTKPSDCTKPKFPGTPALCTANKCVYSECKVKGDCKMNQDCKLTDGINKCVDTTPNPTPAKCNAYKKCPAGQYCHHKECKPGCDKKWSKCKTTTITKGICDGKHSCFKVENNKTGASCRKDKDCSNGYKCVRDHGHDSHCHKAVGDKAACNQKDVLFPDVCDKGFECKRQADKSHKCVKEEHKQHDKYKH